MDAWDKRGAHAATVAQPKKPHAARDGRLVRGAQQKWPYLMTTHPSALPHAATLPLAKRVLQGVAQRSEKRQPNYLNIEIKSPRFKTWTRDVRDIDFDADLKLFEQKVATGNPAIIHVGVYAGVGDHVEVFAKTENDTWIKMDMTFAGSRIIYPANKPSRHLIDPYEVKSGLTLHGLFRTFFDVAKETPFHFTNYNCHRFATALCTKLGTYAGEDSLL